MLYLTWVMIRYVVSRVVIQYGNVFVNHAANITNQFSGASESYSGCNGSFFRLATSFFCNGDICTNAEGVAQMLLSQLVISRTLISQTTPCLS